MPWLPMYLTDDDVPQLVSLLGDDVAFILTDGPGRWRAVREPGTPLTERTCIWHIASGPLPLLRADRDLPDGEVRDPWLGWVEEQTGADPNTPYFGSGHPGVVWLNLRLSGREPASACGMSSLEWIGDHYAILGRSAPEPTRKWWNRVRRKVGKAAEKLPRGGIAAPGVPEVWAFANAAHRLRGGAPADHNP